MAPPHIVDSAGYVECARSLLAGYGCQVRTFTGLSRQLWQPLTIWPPGFPVLIAIVSSLSGVAPPEAGVLISLASAAVALSVIWGIGQMLLPRPVAFTATLATALMPRLLAGNVCMSDALYLALSISAIACLLRGSRLPLQTKYVRWLFFSGLLTGLAWSVRYVGIALMASAGRSWRSPGRGSPAAPSGPC